MKRKILSVLLALVLVLSFSLVTAVPVAAADPAIIEVSKWTEDAANPIFDPDEKAYYPTILFDGTTYQMWYADGTGIRYTTSSDGITWATGVSVTGLTNANHPLVEYYDGFSGANSGSNPSGETMYFRMWYWDTTGAVLYSVAAIRYAESADGTAWYNDQAITGNIIGTAEWNRGSYGPIDVLYNSTATNTGGNPFDYSFAMYFDGTTGAFEEIGLGYSPDGISWTLYGKVLPRGNDRDWGNTDDWDSSYTTFGTIIKEADGKWHMWYSGGQIDSNDGIGYAHSSDGLNWVRSPNNPIMHQNDGVTWRDDRSYCPVVIEDGGIYKMWFSGKDAEGNYAIGYATNTNPDAEYTTIQAAINNANPAGGDTITVAAGTYKEHIVIDKSNLSLIGEDRETTIIVATHDPSLPGEKPGILIGKDPGVGGVTISGFTIRGAVQEGGTASLPGAQAVTGILIYNSDNNVIENNILVNNLWHVFVCAEWSTAESKYLGSSCKNNRIANNIMRDSEQDGVYLYSDGSVFVEDTEIVNNEISYAYGDAASGVEFWGWRASYSGSAPAITGTIVRNNDITNCTYGVRIREGVSDITGTLVNDNEFQNNKVQVLDATEVLDIGQVLDTNTFDRAVVIEGGNVIFSSIQDAIATASSGDTVNVLPGTYYEHIKIDEALTVKSTDGAEVTIIDGIAFRYMVDICSSDVTFEGFTVTNPTYAGGSDATGILIQSTEAMSNVHILDNIITQVRSETGSSSMYGATGINIGKGPLSDIVISGNTITDIKNPDGASVDHTCGINIWDGAENVVISDNTISDIKYNGIMLQYASGVQIEGNSITQCEAGIRVEPFEGVTVSGLTVNFNNIFDNREFGVLNTMNSSIDATHNWWGHASGPSHKLSNGKWVGKGDKVSDNVDYKPWLHKSKEKVVPNKKPAFAQSVVLDNTGDYGWNTFSAPIFLDQEVDTWGELCGFAELAYSLAYRFDSDNQEFVLLTSADEYIINPGEGFFIKMNDVGSLTILYSTEVNLIPPSRPLTAGWNLIGLANLEDMDVEVAFASIAEAPGLAGYSQVISPIGNVTSGAVLADGKIYVGESYWVYMLGARTLAGFTMTPVEWVP